MYQLEFTSQFKKDLKKIKKNSLNFELTKEVLKTLKNEGLSGIDKKMKPHQLKGNYKDNWECHIKPDLLIIWIQIESPKVVTLIRIGSHSNLFK